MRRWTILFLLLTSVVGCRSATGPEPKSNPPWNIARAEVVR